MISPPEIVQAPDSRTVDYRVREALKFMEAHFAEPLTVAEIARRVGISRRRLEDLFRRDTGLTPLRTLGVMRLREAERLLSSTQLSVKEVAARVGFTGVDLSHFRRRFMAFSGATPRRYREASPR
jgi:transcriptional regulator GlxA family with amidase domain